MITPSIAMLTFIALLLQYHPEQGHDTRIQSQSMYKAVKVKTDSFYILGFYYPGIRG
jgi:hypothetical protein